MASMVRLHSVSLSFSLARSLSLALSHAYRNKVKRLWIRARPGSPVRTFDFGGGGGLGNHVKRLHSHNLHREYRRAFSGFLVWFGVKSMHSQNTYSVTVGYLGSLFEVLVCHTPCTTCCWPYETWPMCLFEGTVKKKPSLAYSTRASTYLR